MPRRRRPRRPTSSTPTRSSCRADIVSAAALGVRLFVVDSPEETRKVAEAAPGTAVLCRIVTSGSGSDWPLSRKYGCSTSEAVEVLRLAAALGLDPAGVSFHVGSQQRDPSAWDAPDRGVVTGLRRPASGRSAALAARPRRRLPGRARGRRTGCSTRTAPRSGGRCASSSASRRPRTIIEPGRSIVADSGRLVTSVVAVVHRGDTRWVYLDAGVFTGLVETLDEAIRYRLETDVDRTDRSVRAGRADVRQRRRAVREAARCTCRWRSPRATGSCSPPRAPTRPATRRSGSTASRRCRPSSSLGLVPA